MGDAITYAGGCTCGLSTLQVTLPEPLHHYTPRACDCDYCQALGAAYLSAPGARIDVRSERTLRRERQGSEQAEFLRCSGCGDLLAVIADFEGELRGAVNAQRLEGRAALAPSQPASPKLLDGGTKRERWQSLWGLAAVREGDT
ncbi:MAG: aldehyde-activating protein [Pseudomonadota bacterium]